MLDVGWAMASSGSGFPLGPPLSQSHSWRGCWLQDAALVWLSPTRTLYSPAQEDPTIPCLCDFNQGTLTSFRSQSLHFKKV